MMASFVALLVLVSAYLLPTIIAACRRHPDLFWIHCLNLGLGMTVWGWITAFYWAIMRLPKPGDTTTLLTVRIDIVEYEGATPLPPSDGDG